MTNEIPLSQVKELLNILHDRLSYILSDPSGEIFHGDEFENVFNSVIDSLDWR